LEKEAVVALAHAVVEPWAVVVELIDARVADAAVRATRRSVEVASLDFSLKIN
jgi:hypothetical protein